MAANYRPMLELADEMALFQRYLSPEEEKACAKIEGAFNDERRKFVYDLIKDDVPPGEHIALVERDLDRIGATGNHYEFAIQHVRDELHRHIEKQLGSSPLMRVVTRWGPPAAILIFTSLAIYIRSNR